MPAERKHTEEELQDAIKRMQIAYEQSLIYARQLNKEIAERRQAEEALRESQTKYRILVEHANDAIFIVQAGVIEFPNPKTEEVFGYPGDQLDGMPFAELVAAEDRDMVVERHKRSLSAEDVPSTYSFRIINKFGERLWVGVNAAPITWEGKRAILYFLRDITPQKKLEAQFLRAQKMEAIATLASGIAHDFNNLLMSIQGYTSLMMIKIDSMHPHLVYLRGIEDTIRKGACLTTQLLSFARGDKYEVKLTDLNELIKKSSEMFGRTKREINVSGKYQKDLWPVEVDPVRIEQVLLNLYVNAWQAMPGGGSLYLTTENVTLDEHYVKPFDVVPGRYVKISVTDTGVGMDKETQRRIFEPFFTTKEMDKGTGLGLASAYGIIKNHDGIINVYSEKGGGATFNIYLPAAKGVEYGEESGIEEKEIPRGHETILLVDDEDMIINVGREMLESLGYKVLVARSGNEAIEVYRKNKEDIDLVILDMIMPDVGGGGAYDKMKEINPNMKILLSSGYGIDGQAREILERGCDSFIQKPFNMKQLSQSIRKILAG